MEKNLTTTNGRRDQTEEVALDWTYPQEATIQHHTPDSTLEHVGKEKRTRGDVAPTPREQHALARGYQSCAAPRETEDCRRWPMFLKERQALVLVSK